MEITRGKIGGALKICVYGPEGIGKSTFASKFPNPIFIDTEGSTKFMDVARFAAPSSWTMLMEQVRHVLINPGVCGTLVIDTGDWAEQMCITKICADYQKKGIEDFSYGKGYVYLQEEFGRLLNLLEDVVRSGIYVVLNCHAKMRKFEQPDEMGAYDRWELKLQRTVAPLVKEWADIILFANYKTFVVNVDDQGTAKGKNKAQGGKRVMYATHHPCWDAKNRHGLKDELPFDYAEIAHLTQSETPAIIPEAPKALTQSPMPEPQKSEKAAEPADMKPPESMFKELPTPSEGIWEGIPRGLADLMREAKIFPAEIQEIVAQKRYFPIDTPISNYPLDFVQGVLIGAWPQVRKQIEESSSRLPF